MTARAWRAAEEADLGGWRLNASAGYSGRINACWPLGRPGMATDAAVAAVEAWYAARGLPARFKLAAGAVTPDDLSERLAQAGYAPGAETLVMTGPANGGRQSSSVVVEEDPGPPFMTIFRATSDVDGEAQERLETLWRIPRPRAFGVARLGREPAAIGACAVEPPWVGVFAMRTLPAARRMGMARAVLGALTERGAALGAHQAWLQVESANAAAIALYQGAGFREAYRYAYWTSRP